MSRALAADVCFQTLALCTLLRGCLGWQGVRVVGGQRALGEAPSWQQGRWSLLLAWAWFCLVPRCSGGMFLWHSPSPTQPRLCCARGGGPEPSRGPEAGRTHGSARQEQSLGKACRDCALPAAGSGRARTGRAGGSLQHPRASAGPVTTARLEEPGGSQPRGVPGESCTRRLAKAFAHRRESNPSVGTRYPQARSAVPALCRGDGRR